MLTRTLGLGLLAAALASASPELARRQDNGSGPQVYLNSESDFCLFLPPQPGLEVAPHENDGIPFCTTAGAVPNAQAFPQGFLTTAHFQQTDSYQQITGYFNRDAYQLQASDGGGQYDNHGAGKPVNAACRNYEYFLSIIEPSDNRFCIRCCHNKDDCPTGRSQYGCQRNIPGDYSMSAQANDGSQASGAPAESSAPAPSQAASSDPAQSSDASGQQAPQQQAPQQQVAASTQHNNAAFDSVLYDMDTLQNQASGVAQKVEDKVDSAGDALSNEASQLANQLQDNHANAATEEEASSSDQQIQGQWSGFLQSLSSQFPDKQQDIEKLKQLTSNFSSEEDWQRLISSLSSSADSSSSDSSSSSTPADETQHEDQAMW